MRNIRKRYVALQIDNTQHVEEKQLMSAIWEKVYELFGEVGASQTALSRINYDKNQGIIILRCSHKKLDETIAAVSALTEIDKLQVVPHVVAISGTLKALKNKLSKLTGGEPLINSDFNHELKAWLKNAKKIVVVGIGNELRKDDFIGVQVVKELEGRVSNKVMLIESETVPESYMDSIIKFQPTHVMLIDAGLLGLEPGNMNFIKASSFLSLTSTPISTHALPLQIFCEYIQQATNAKLALIIIEPKDTAFGEGLSVEIKDTATKLTKSLLLLLN